MIGSLRGELIERSGGEVLVEVAAVGYRVIVSPATAVTAGELGDTVFLHIHHHFREDDQTLYGFSTREERVCFQALISAHGVGPSLGLAILGVHDPAGLQTVLATEDLAALCLVPGVGKKTAQRLLVELKEKLDLPDLDLTAASTPASAGTATELNDVREALSGLGYGPDEIQAAIKELPLEGDASVLLKHALQRLAVNS
jgi:Holliday junction DNA helicase RuvA